MSTIDVVIEDSAIGHRPSEVEPEFDTDASACTGAPARAYIRCLAVGGSVAARVCRWSMAEFRPPEIWPVLAPVWAYAVHGAQAPAEGPTRLLCRLFAAVVSLPVHTVCEIAKWITARPSRLAMVALLWGVLSQTRYGSFLPWFW